MNDNLRTDRLSLFQAACNLVVTQAYCRMEMQLVWLAGGGRRVEASGQAARQRVPEAG